MYQNVVNTALQHYYINKKRTMHTLVHPMSHGRTQSYTYTIIQLTAMQVGMAIHTFLSKVRNSVYITLFY